MAARSLAAGVFAGKNDPKSIDGVPGVDARPIGKNTNNWQGINRVPGIDGRPMGSSQRDVAKLARSKLVAARELRQFPNVKCKQAWHICQFFFSFCQVNEIVKSKCQTVG